MIESTPKIPTNEIIIPRWMPIAFGECGVIEDTRPGKSTPRIEFYHSLTKGGPALDEVAWCSSGMVYVFEASGIATPRTKRAADWALWGVAVNGWPFGALLLFGKSDKDAKGSGHVALCVGASGGDVFVYGGNQGDRWSYATRRQKDVVAKRWPKSVQLPESLGAA